MKDRMSEQDINILTHSHRRLGIYKCRKGMDTYERPCDREIAGMEPVLMNLSGTKIITAHRREWMH